MSKDTENALNKGQHPLRFKTLEKLGVKEISLNIINVLHENPKVNITLNGEKLKAVSLKSGTRPVHPVSSFLLCIILEILVRAIRQEKESKGMHKGKGKVKLSLLVDDIIPYLEAPKATPEELIIKCSKIARYNYNIYKSLSCTPMMNLLKHIRKVIILLYFTTSDQVVTVTRWWYTCIC